MMASDGDFRIHYWGTTGSFPSPLAPEAVLEKVVGSIARLQELGVLAEIAREGDDLESIRQLVTQHVPPCIRSTYGGNTTCVELETPDGLIILDSGSGFRRLGLELTRRWNDPQYAGQRKAYVLLTHSHLDHTNATPFVDPYYDARNHFQIWATKAVLDSLHALLSPSSVMRSVYFPPTYEMLSGIKDFRTIDAGEELQIGQTRITSHELNHPGGCLAFRFERDGRSFVFASDHEHAQGADLDLAEFAREADLLYLDAQYLREEYEGQEGIGDERPMPREGWGHSTVEAVVDTALEARVKRLHLGHHDPGRSDQGLAYLEQVAQQRAAKWLATQDEKGRPAPLIELAREGLEIRI